MIGLGVTLADDQAGLVQNVFAVTAVDGIDLFCNLRQRFLLCCYGHAFEDAIIAAADARALIICQMFILWDFDIIGQYAITADAVNNRSHLIIGNMNRALRNDMADAVTD